MDRARRRRSTGRWGSRSIHRASSWWLTRRTTSSAPCSRVRRLEPGLVSTFAGTGLAGSRLGAVAATDLVAPAGLALGPHGEVYVTDSGHAVIRVLTP